MKIRTIFLPIVFFCVTGMQSTLSMNMAITVAKGAVSGLCSTAEIMMTCAPLLDKCLLNPADRQAEKLKNTQSNAPESVTHFVTKIAHSRGINNVKVVLAGDAHDYSTNDNGNIIFIPNKQAQELTTLLGKSTLTSEEQEQLNEHTGTLHHELTHGTMRSLKYAPMYDAAIGTAGALSLSTALTRFTHKYYPSIQQNFALRNAFKLTRGALVLPFAVNLMNMNFYKKYDEL